MRADKKTIFSLAPDFQVDKNTRLGNFTLEGKLIFFNDPKYTVKCKARCVDVPCVFSPCDSDCIYHDFSTIMLVNTLMGHPEEEVFLSASVLYGFEASEKSQLHDLQKLEQMIGKTVKIQYDAHLNKKYAIDLKEI